MVGAPLEPRTGDTGCEAAVRLDGVGIGHGGGARGGGRGARGGGGRGAGRGGGAQAVLADVTLRIAPGERVVLLGRNGTGKTTLLRIIAGLLAPERGRVETAVPLGYVPQNYRLCLFPWFRVRTNLALAAQGRPPAAEVTRQIDAALDVVPLGRGLLDRFPYRLSGGEQQLVVLARALVGRPALLLLDEPFSALDAPARLHLRSTLRDRLSGTTLLFVSHDLDDAVAVADRALVLDGKPGRLVADVSFAGASSEDVRARFAALLGGMS